VNGGNIPATIERANDWEKETTVLGGKSEINKKESSTASHVITGGRKKKNKAKVDRSGIPSNVRKGEKHQGDERERTRGRRCGRQRGGQKSWDFRRETRRMDFNYSPPDIEERRNVPTED